MVVAILLAWGAYEPAALALPSFALQTGQPCSSCHIGSFGAQLTSAGRDFKLLGYADGASPDYFPLSGMLLASFTHTSSNQPGGAAPDFGPNNNFALDQAALWFGGRLMPHLGAFVQVTYDGVGHALGIDNADIRYGRALNIGGTDTIIGISLNNAPAVQDIYNTTPVWRFPYVASALAPTPNAAARIENGFDGQVAGLTAYMLWNDLIYLEAGGYASLSEQDDRALGVQPSDEIDGVAPYWRLALQQEFGRQFIEAGTFGLAGQVYPGFQSRYGTDSFADVGIDAMYQFHVSKTHDISVYLSDIIEHSRLGASYTGGTASRVANQLNSLNANASYYFRQRYGLTLAYAQVSGTPDDLLFAGAGNGKPDSKSLIAQIDWTPFGHRDSFARPWVNLRVGLQFTHYLELDGASGNVSGLGTNAAGADSIYLFTWIAF